MPGTFSFWCTSVIVDSKAFRSLAESLMKQKDHQWPSPLHCVQNHIKTQVFHPGPISTAKLLALQFALRSEHLRCLVKEVVGHVHMSKTHRSHSSLCHFQARPSRKTSEDISDSKCLLHLHTIRMLLQACDRRSSTKPGMSLHD